MKYFVIGCLLLSAGWLQGQNLIPNGDFELGPDSSSTNWLEGFDSTCVITDTIGGPDFWTVTNPSPDRLVEGNIPCNWDNDTAAFGSAYVVFGGSLLSSESGKTTLLSPLITDSSYHLSYYVQVETARNTLLDPTKVAFVFNNSDTIFSPLISDTIQWVRYDTTFIASSSATELELMSASPTFSGFKIDSITLRKTTTPSILPISLENYLKIFPNPTKNGIINLQYRDIKNIEYKLCNALGKEIDIGSFKNKKKIDLTEYSHGIYFLQLRIDDSIFTKKIIYH